MFAAKYTLYCYRQKKSDGNSKRAVFQANQSNT